MAGKSESYDLTMVAGQQISAIEHYKLKVIDEHSASYRWLLASLFILNSGGLAAHLNSSFSKYQTLSALSFYIGVTFALIAAVLGQRFGRVFTKELEKFVFFWLQVKSSGDLNEKDYEERNKAMEKASKSGRWLSISGLMSFVGFSLGILFIFLGRETAMPAKHESKKGEVTQISREILDIES